MALSSSSKENISLKKLVGKAHTSNNLEAFNESKSTGITISSQAVISETIPSSPSNTNLYDITSNVVEYVRLVATPLNESIVDGKYHAFKLSLPSDYETSSSSTKAGTSIFLNSQDIHLTNGALQVVPPSFYDAYEAKVYYGGDGTKGSGTRIPLLDNRSWYLDYFNGILFQETPPDNSNENPTHVEAYIYIGKMASERFSEGADGGASQLDNLTDVTLGNIALAEDQVLVYTSNNVFENKILASTQLSDSASIIRTTSSITELADVNTTGVADGNVLTWNVTDGEFQVSAPAQTYTDEMARDAAGSALAVGNHTGITFVNDDDNDRINAVVSLNSFSIGALSDVDVAGAVDGKILKYNNGTFEIADETDTNTQLSDEEVQDIVGGMVDGGTETDITVSYDDDAGKLNFVIDDTIARINSPSFTGIPLAPTAALGTSTTQIASTAFVLNEISDLDLENTYQPLDAALTSISELTTSAGLLIYTTAEDTYATSSLTEFARSILDDADAAAVRTTLGLGTAATSDTGDFLAANAALNDVSDVLIANVANAQILVYDSDAGANDNKWKNVSLSSDITITNLGVATISNDAITTDKILNQNVTNNKLANPFVNITDGSNTDKLNLGETITFNGTDNEIELSVTNDVTGSVAGASITIGLPDNVTIAQDLTVSGDMVITGDFTVNGVSSTISTTNLDVEDSIISLNNGLGDVSNPATRDIGFFLDRGNLDPALIFWDEADDVFKIGSHSGAVTSSSTDLGSAGDGFTFESLQLKTADPNSNDNTAATTSWVTTKLNTEIGAIAINDLADVDTTGKAEDKILKFNADGNLVVGEITGFTADTSSMWAVSDDGTELYPHGIIDGTLDTGMFAINLSAGSIDYSSQEVTLYDILEELSSINAYTPSLKDAADINDTYFEFDVDGNIMPKA